MKRVGEINKPTEKTTNFKLINLIIDTHVLRYSPTAGTTPAAITYGTHKDSSSTEMTGAASLPMMNWRSILRIPFA